MLSSWLSKLCRSAMLIFKDSTILLAAFTRQLHLVTALYSPSFISFLFPFIFSDLQSPSYLTINLNILTDDSECKNNLSCFVGVTGLGSQQISQFAPSLTKNHIRNNPKKRIRFYTILLFGVLPHSCRKSTQSTRHL